MSVEPKRVPRKYGPVLSLFLLVVLIALFLACSGAAFIVEFPLRLLFGWIAFIHRNLAEITVSWPGLLTFMILLAATLAMTRYLGQSLLGTKDRPFTFRTALAVTILLVALFAAGIGAAGVAHQAGWLIRSPEPLLQSSFTVVRRMQDSQNQKLVGLAVHGFHSDQQGDEPIRSLTLRDDRGSLLHGWQTQLLPFMDQQPLYESINKTESWNSPENQEPLGNVIPNYLRLDRSPETEATHAGSYALSHLAANRLILGDAKIKRFDDISDGLANTLLLGSARGRFLPWGHPQGWRGPDHLPNEDERGFGSGFQGGCHIAMADGSVIFVTDSIDRRLWEAIFTPNGEESVEELMD